MTQETGKALAVPSASERFKELQAQLEAFPPSQYNLLIPSAAQELSPFFRPVVSVVRIVPGGDDTYAPAGSRDKLALHAHALQRLSNAMAISWEPTQVTKDGRWTWNADSAGWWVHPNGERVRVPGSYTLDMEEDGVIVKRTRAKVGKVMGNYTFTAADAERDIDSYRQFGRQRAETGARSRVIRAICGMKATYTPAELAKPFVVVLFRPDERHPDVAKALTDRIRQQDQNVFGKPAGFVGEVRELSAGHGDAAEDLELGAAPEPEPVPAPAPEPAAAPTPPAEPPVVREEEPAPKPVQAQLVTEQPTTETVIAHYRKRVDDWRKQLTSSNGAPWSKAAREKAASERQVGMVAGMIQKALQLNDEEAKTARRAILAALWGGFNDYAELNSDQVSATIDWAKEKPAEVVELYKAVLP